MKPTRSIGGIRTLKHIRTRLSILTSTGPGHNRWLRLKETEQLRSQEVSLPARARRNWRMDHV